MSEAAVPQPPQTTDPGPSLDERLQASRRLDWRFLMPDPALGDVALLGSPDCALRVALELFANRLVEHRGAAEAGDSFDLLIGVNPSEAEWRAGLSAVRPGGHAYLELTQRPGLRATATARHTRQLEALGYQDITRHWHWPGFEQHSALLDLDAPAALGHFLQRKWPGAQGLVLAALGRAFSRLGAVDRIARHCSVLGRRRAR